MEPEWITAGAASVAACTAVVAVVAAWRTATTGAGTLRRVSEDSRERSRPQLAAELQPDDHSRGTQYLVLSNYGPGVAVDVRVTFEPPVADDPTSRYGKRSLLTFIVRRYAEPIPTFTPGMVLRNVYYNGVRAADGQLSNSERGADRFTVTLTYKSATGDQYADRFTLDTGVIYEGTWSESSRHPDRTRERQAKEVGRAAAALHQLALVHTRNRGLPRLLQRVRERRAQRHLAARLQG